MYIDGVSITLGDPRKHIWAYATGLSDNFAYEYCPCARNSSLEAPVFVGDYYYCESGNTTFYTEDPVDSNSKSVRAVANN